MEDVVRKRFLPILTGQSTFSNRVEDQIALPSQLGGLGITNQVKQEELKYRTSCRVPGPLVKHIIEQLRVIPAEEEEKQFEAKREAHNTKHQAQSAEANHLLNILPSSMQKAVEIAQETEASIWLTAVPIAEHGFALHKVAFQDALCLRYAWRLPLLTSQCVGDKTITVEHALSCLYGGFPTIHHNEVRNITAQLMSDACHNFGIEPTLQPITNERLRHNTANT